MKLLEVAHESFRNLHDGCVELAPSVTVLLGDNGQGKTSFLEAIGMLATTRSFRRAKPQDIPRHGERTFRIRGKVETTAGRTTELMLAHEEGRRITHVGRAGVELAEYVGHLTVIAIAQGHAGIVRGSPQERRDFLDRGILGLRPGYLRSLADHRRSLRNKNALLRRSAGQPDPRQLATWNEQLSRDAAEIVFRRREYVDGLSGVLSELGERFLPEGEQLHLALQDVLSRRPGVGVEDLQAFAALDREGIAALLLARMDELGPREVAAAQALVGPHRDDLVLSSGERDLRRFSSSGQQRNALLALKMSKVELFRRSRGEAPVLLVDDVDTEIDPTRLSTFLEQVEGRAQVVMTSSKQDLFQKAGKGSIFHVVSKGNISRSRPLL